MRRETKPCERGTIPHKYEPIGGYTVKNYRPGETRTEKLRRCRECGTVESDRKTGE